MQPVVTDSRSVAILSPAKTAEPIEMPYHGLWTCVGPWSHVLDRVQMTHLKCSVKGVRAAYWL